MADLLVAVVPEWAGIDIRAEFQQHWHTHGGVPDDLHHRLVAYQTHIGPDVMSDNAFTGRWADLARNAEQVLAVSS